MILAWAYTILGLLLTYAAGALLVVAGFTPRRWKRAPLRVALRLCDASDWAIGNSRALVGSRS